MTDNIVTLNLPSWEGVPGLSNVGGWFLLENTALRFANFPADAEIVRSYAWSQRVGDYQAGAYGDMTWGVCPKLYRDLSGLPAQERCQPMGTGLLGCLLFRPGAHLLDWRDHPHGIPYRPGDAIGVFPEGTGITEPVYLFMGLQVRSATGFEPLPGIVYHDIPNKSAVGQGAFSFRNPIQKIPSGGTEARVTVLGLEHGVNLLGMSIGVRAGAAGHNMVDDPVPVTFDGQAALNLGAATYRRSDWVPLNTAPGNTLLVHSCVSGFWPYKDVDRTFSNDNLGCFVAGTSGLSARNFSGTLQLIPDPVTPGVFYHRTHVTAMIEVK